MLTGGVDCDWTIIIGTDNAPLLCDGFVVAGCTYYNQKLIYLDEWNTCVLFHEITEHAQRQNNGIHGGDCWRNLQAEQQWSQYMREASN